MIHHAAWLLVAWFAWGLVAAAILTVADYRYRDKFTIADLVCCLWGALFMAQLFSMFAVLASLSWIGGIVLWRRKG